MASAATLKIRRQGTVHRVPLQEQQATYEAVVEAIQKIYPSEVTAKYLDDEGDLCVLCAATFSDFLHTSSAAGGRLVLRLELFPVSRAPAAAWEAERAERARPENASPAATAPMAAIIGAMQGLKGHFKGAWKGKGKGKGKAHSGSHAGGTPGTLRRALRQLHSAGMLSGRCVAAVVANSLGDLVALAAEQTRVIDWAAEAKPEVAREVMQALLDHAACAEGLEDCAGKLEAALAGDAVPASEALLALLTGLSELTFGARVSFLETLYTSQQERIDGLLDEAQPFLAMLPPMPAEHSQHICDGCDQGPLRGPRFSCKCCENYDLCARCFADRDSLFGGRCAGHDFETIAGTVCGMGKGKCKGKGKHKGGHDTAAAHDAEAAGVGCQHTLRAREQTNDTISVPNGYSVVAAFYGDASRGKGRDVTDIVKSREASGQVLRASNELFGDPIFGTEKTLFVDFEVSAPASSTDCDSQAATEKGQGKGKGKGKDKGKGKGKGKDKSKCESTGLACANASCGFQVTWHSTHCCIMCKQTDGKGHGSKCDKVPVADAVSVVKEPPTAPSAAAADADTEASDPGLQKQVDVEVSVPANSTDCDSQVSADCDSQATTEKDQGKGKGKDKGKGKGKGKDKSKCEGTGVACANASCGFQVTWHSTHCCNMCNQTDGKTHGPKCNKVPVPVAEGAAPELPAPTAAGADETEGGRGTSFDFSIPVAVGDGRHANLEWNLVDDPQEVAEAFVAAHGVLPEELPTLRSFVEQHTAAAAARRPA